MSFLKNIEIGTKVVTDSGRTLIIAEAGVNHNGDVSLAKGLIREAAAAGADCIKFQTFKAERVVTQQAPKAEYQLQVTDRGESQLAMLRKLELGQDYYPELMAYAKEQGLIFLSTPYNFEDVEFLQSLDVVAYKVASGQIVEHAFLRKVAQTGKPIILSSGMATIEEIEAALETLRQAGNDQVILLQCTTNYPSTVEDANLRVIPALQIQADCLVGYSDHTLGDEAALAAVALGASVIEKHFTLDTRMPGPDHAASMTPEEFTSLVAKIRRVELSLGVGRKEPTARERENARGMRRSIVATRSIRKGDIIRESDLTFKRPATGLQPRFFDTIIGKKAARDIACDELLQKDGIEWEA